MLAQEAACGFGARDILGDWWWFQIFFCFHPLFGVDIQFDYIIFFKGVETTNQLVIGEYNLISFASSGFQF